MHVTVLFKSLPVYRFPEARDPNCVDTSVQGESWFKGQDSIMLNAPRKRESLNKFDINKPNIPRSVQAHQYCCKLISIAH